jgi:hypothetical protein
MNIEELQLHDAPLTGVNIDFDKRTITVRYLSYNEERKDYDIRELHFIDVRKVLVDFPETKEYDAEIFSMELEDICTGNTRVEFMFHFGPSMPSGELKFEYSNVKLR